MYKNPPMSSYTHNYYFMYSWNLKNLTQDFLLTIHRLSYKNVFCNDVWKKGEVGIKL